MMVLFVIWVVAAAPTDRFEDVAASLASHDDETSVREMLVWVAEHEGEEAARGLVWVARRRLDDGQRDAARDALTRASHSSGHFGSEASRLLSALHLEDRQFDDAERAARVLLSSTEPGIVAQGKALLSAIDSARARWRVFACVASLLAVDVVLRVVRGRRHLWPPPLEVWVLGPILGSLVVIALLRHAPVLASLGWLAIGGVVVAWARGAGRSATSLNARLADASLAVLESIALAFVVFEANGVLDMLIETARSGPA